MNTRRLHALATFVIIAGLGIVLTRVTWAHDDDRHDNDRPFGHPTPGFVPHHDDDDDEFRIREGFRIVREWGIKLNLKGKDPKLVGLGSYLVNAVSECNDCHTFPMYAPGGDPFQGQPEQINTENYLAGGAPFFGPFVPRNLTPDATGKPAGLTLREFIHIIRTGEDDEPPVLPDGSDTLLQVMPWPTFRKMANHDLHAIYEFLSSIPHAEPAPPPPMP
jgi:hypothetical protein